MSLKEQMTEAALRIYPYSTLAQLCYATSLDRPRPTAERLALFRILHSGNIYLTPIWISQVYPISTNALRHIAKDWRLRGRA